MHLIKQKGGEFELRNVRMTKNILKCHFLLEIQFSSVPCQRFLEQQVSLDFYEKYVRQCPLFIPKIQLVTGLSLLEVSLIKNIECTNYNLKLRFSTNQKNHSKSRLLNNPKAIISYHDCMSTNSKHPTKKNLCKKSKKLIQF